MIEEVLLQVLNRCLVGYWSIICSIEPEVDTETLLEVYDVVVALPH
jgi:hypothetical protein